jgi:hypothetical protein
MRCAATLYVGGHFDFVSRTPATHLEPCASPHIATIAPSRARCRGTPEPTPHGLLVIGAGVERIAFGGYMTRMGGIDQEGLAVYKAPHLP